MRILFRTDADAQIGTGHLMRCLALADALRLEGAQCVFLCRGAGLGALAEKITEVGHVLIPLQDVTTRHAELDLPKLAHAHWLPGGWRNDVAACLKVLEDQPAADWMIVDHYALDSRWEKAMRIAAGRIMAIDDLADRQHDCDVLLDQNVLPEMGSDYRGLISPTCLSLLGPKYALLRPEFSRPCDTPTKFTAHASGGRLLIMFGGGDPQNLTLRTVKALVRIGWRGPVDVVVGPLHPKIDEVSSALTCLPAARLHAPAHNVADLMRAANLAVGSPGVASWERCACGLPSIVLSVADNQLRLGETLAQLGAHWYLGSAEQVSDMELDAALVAWLGNPMGRQCMRTAAANVCDGNGVRRVVRRLVGDRLTIRRATEGDAQLVYTWRNDERTRRYFFDPSPVELSTHLGWFSRTIKSVDSQLLIVCRGSHAPAGCVRFDYGAGRARLSIYIDPDLQGHGLGVSALHVALDWLRSNRPGIAVVEADVLTDNEASKKTFLAAGFRERWSRYEYRQ